MKFITFIKAYKIALDGISNRVKDWHNVYLSTIEFPKEDEVLRFIFSDSYNAATGGLAISAALNTFQVELYKGGLGSVYHLLPNEILAKEYVKRKEQINEAGRFLILLDCILDNFKKFKTDDYINSACIKDIEFNFESDVSKFTINDSFVYTNGIMTMAGD
jgi:hypothetical protein